MSLWFLFLQVKTTVKTIVTVVMMIRINTTDIMAAIMAVFSLAIPRPLSPSDEGLGFLFWSEGETSDDGGADVVPLVDAGTTIVM